MAAPNRRHLEDAYDLAAALNPLTSSGHETPSVQDIRDLLERDPSAARFVDYNGQTLLHICVAFLPTRLDLIQVLVESHPQALLTEDHGPGRRLPLEVVLWEAGDRLASTQQEVVSTTRREEDLATTVQYLVEQGPEALVHENSHGQFPLHVACSVPRNDDTGWTTKRSNSNTSNHGRRTTNEDTAEANDEASNHVIRGNLALIQILVQGFPDALWHPDNNGHFPLDCAMQLNARGSMAPARVVEFLIDQAPSVLREAIPNAHGQLPLHKAVAAAESTNRSTGNTFLSAPNNHLAMVQLLADRFPRALLMQDTHNATPLLHACIHDKASLDVIYTLVRQWPEQVTWHKSNLVFDDSHWNGQLLPLALVSESMTLQRAQEWVSGRGDNDKMQSLDKGGDSSTAPAANRRVLTLPDGTLQRLPLHYAAASQSMDAVEIVQFLLELYPEAASIPDTKGRLPLHYAAVALGIHEQRHRQAPDSGFRPTPDQTVVHVLMQSYPTAMVTTDHDGLLPWHYAACCQSTYVVTDMATSVADRLYDETVLCDDGNCDVDTYLVPEEVRWDIIQVSATPPP